jgi:hypothetical protein
MPHHYRQSSVRLPRLTALFKQSVTGGSTVYTHGKRPASTTDAKMKTFYEWPAEREERQCEGFWLNDKNALIRLLKLNPLPKDSAVNKSLNKKLKPPLSDVPVFKPCKAAEPARLEPFKPAYGAYITSRNTA